MTAKSRNILTSAFVALTLTGCSTPIGGLFNSKPTEMGVAQTPSDTDQRPKSRPIDTSEPLTVENATALSDAEIAAATKPTKQTEQDKGLTIASLGLLNQDGFWLSTPLVTSQEQGRVVVEKTGASANVILLPNGAVAGAGSQLSVAAMQVLDVAITDLVELRVFVQ